MRALLVGWPQLYTAWYKPVYITSMLAVTMLCMGFTLSVNDITGLTLYGPVRFGQCICASSADKFEMFNRNAMP